MENNISTNDENIINLMFVFDGILKKFPTRSIK